MELLERGVAIGRYVVLGVAGEGAMGVVYRAYDPELQREVALKLLRPTAAARLEVASARLRREAQAMARVSHPNVLPIYDTGTFAGQVWIAMEFLRSEVLSEWLASARRTTAEIVAMFSMTGRGLAAAHASGLVHRDFKPQNVLIGADNRPRVTDFGLARAIASGDEDRGRAEGNDPMPDAELTLAGRVVGTPRYMAPEQHDGAVVDARADQFAFCVALYEALYRVTPFVGDNLAQLAVRKHERRLAEVGRDADVPGWLHRVILRGLEPDPSRRFATMDDLLVALSDDPRGRRRRILAWATGGIVVAAGLAGANRWLANPRPCEDAARKLVGVWDDDRRARVGSAIRDTGVPYADTVIVTVQSMLDEYAAQWISKHNEACAATKVHGEQSNEFLDARIVCFDAARADVAAVVDLLEAADDTMVEEAVRTVASLRGITECDARPELLQIDRAPPDAESVATIATIDETLSRGRALLAAGKEADAALVLEPALVAARELGFNPVLAEAARLLSDATGSADVERGRVLALEALAAALAGNARRTAADALLALVYIDAYALKHTESARQWAGIADPLIASLGDERQEITLINLRAITAFAAGELELGEELAAEAVSRARAASSDPSRLAGLLGNLGATMASRGRLVAARAYLSDALEILEATLGPDHPKTLAASGNLATVDIYEQRIDDAVARLEANLAREERVLAPEHPQKMATLNNLANALRLRGDNAGALALHRRILGMRERRYGPNSADVAQSLHNLSVALRLDGQLAEARVSQDRALKLRIELVSPDHPDLASSWLNESLLRESEGDVPGAIAAIDAALAIAEPRLGATHITTVNARLIRADLMAIVDPGRGVAQLEQLLADVERAGVHARQLGEVRFSLAKLHPSPTRARQLANDARTVVVNAGLAPEFVDEIDAWLRDHP